MDPVLITDTNVVIGLAIKQDAHHDNSRDFVEGSGNKVYVPPTAMEEFNDLEKKIRRSLRQDISKHQNEFDKGFGNWDGKLKEKHVKYLKNQVLSDDNDAAPFLRKWYDGFLQQSLVEVHRLRIEQGLADFVLEVSEDACEDIGGWENLVGSWTKDVGGYNSIKNALLIDGNDLEICLEAHHIATEMDEPTKIGTADGDFIDCKDGEPKTRKEDIRDRTSLDDVVDLR